MAQVAVSLAIRTGKLKPAHLFNCADCGSKASQYEHRDYSKPLDVDPVCPRCNRLRGPADGSSAKSALARG